MVMMITDYNKFIVLSTVRKTSNKRPGDRVASVITLASSPLSLFCYLFRVYVNFSLPINSQPLYDIY